MTCLPPRRVGGGRERGEEEFSTKNDGIIMAVYLTQFPESREITNFRNLTTDFLPVKWGNLFFLLSFYL